MGIQPIDLQTLYTQLEKVGKAQAQQQQGAQQAQNAQMDVNRLKAEERLSKVQESDTDERAGTVREREGDGKDDAGSGERRERPDAESAPPEPDHEVIRDPALGKHIDISG